MVGGWRRAFCTTISKDQEPRIGTEKMQKQKQSNELGSRFGFFSNPSTPRLQSDLIVSSPNLRCRTTKESIVMASAPGSPRLHCKSTKNSPRLFFRSTPSSPKSPSSLSIFRKSSRISKNRCGICLQSLKTGKGMAIFSAECSHGFHFPCISAYVRKQGNLVCPVCNAHWKEVPTLPPHNNQKPEAEKDDYSNKRESVVKKLRVYNDDEPLMSPKSGGNILPIPESDENEEDEEFQGFVVNSTPVSSPKLANTVVNPAINVDMKLLPEAAVISVGRSSETYAVVLKVKAPSSTSENVDINPLIVTVPNRAPIDLVTVIDVSERMSGEKQQSMKRAMKLVISSLSSNDRLSIVAFSTTSKRLLPLKRMTANGRLSGRRIVDALCCTGIDACIKDAEKKAVKILEDRRERNSVASILLLSDGCDIRTLHKSNLDRPGVNNNFPVYKFGFIENGAYSHASNDDVFARYLRGILSVVNQDLRLEVGFVPGSTPAQISAIYTFTNGQPTLVGPGSIRLGDLYVDEERKLLIELKVPISSIGSHHVLSVRSSYKDTSSQKLVLNKELALLVPRPHAVRSSSPNIQRLRFLFITSRAVAESRRLLDRNDLSGAYRMLDSARAVLIQSRSSFIDGYLSGLEAELAELNRRRQLRNLAATVSKEIGVCVEEPLTPTSAWKAAERLAKVAIMKKSLNRVSDLHGFENARF